MTLGATEKLVDDPLKALSLLQATWVANKTLHIWGSVIVELIAFVDDILRGGSPLYLSSKCGAELLMRLEGMHSQLMDVQLQRTICPSATRSADGILNADQGVFPFLEDCLIEPLEDALADMDLAGLGNDGYWMCHACGRPTSDPVEEHMAKRHESEPGQLEILTPPPPLCMTDIVQCLQAKDSLYPACTVYSMESPLYKAANKAMREWNVNPGAFDKMKKFAALLDHELQQIDVYTGSAYRAIDFQVPPTLYQKGAVVTWNQPSSASTSPKVAKLFLQGGLGAVPSGTLFILNCATARPISPYSMHPEEQEVLFRAGTQFQVLSRANDGLKSLLEGMMWCSLEHVEVYELRELTLDSWRDLPQFLEPVDQLRNQELLRFINTLPAHWGTCRRETKLLCAPMSTLISRDSDKNTALHMAAAIPHNLACLYLVSAQLRREDFTLRNMAGLTALRVAVHRGNWDAAAYILHRGASLEELKPADLHRGMPWFAQYGHVELLRSLCAVLSAEQEAIAQEALQIGLSVACLYRSKEVVEIFLDAGADVTAISPCQTHEPTLVACASGGNVDTLQLLVDRGANVERDGGWALYAAACACHVAVVRKLLELNVCVKTASADDGRTPLMAASLVGQVDVVKALLEAGDDVKCSDHGGRTALMLAAQNAHVDVITALVAAQADVHAMDVEGRNALIYAAQSGHVNAIRVLVELKATVDAIANHYGGQTALMCAAHHGHVAAVQTLLQLQADVNRGNGEGYTALMYSARRGHNAIVQTLLQAKANIFATNVLGRTAAVYAAQSSRWTTYELLLKAKEEEEENCDPLVRCDADLPSPLSLDELMALRSPKAVQCGQSTWLTLNTRRPTTDSSTDCSDNTSSTFHSAQDCSPTLSVKSLVSFQSVSQISGDFSEPLAASYYFGSPRRTIRSPTFALDEHGRPRISPARSNSYCADSPPSEFAHSSVTRAFTGERYTSSDFESRMRQLLQREASEIDKEVLLQAPVMQRRKRISPQCSISHAKPISTSAIPGGPLCWWYCSNKILGRGSSGEVYLGMSETGILVAIKRIAVQEEKRSHLAEDLQMLSTLYHPNVISWLGSGPHEDQMLVVLEYAATTLAKLIAYFGKLPTYISSHYIRDATRGLHYLHMHNVVHREIKPETLLIDQHGACKVSWSLKAIFSEPNDFTITEAAHWMAPEMADGNVGKEADVWGLGATLWYMLTGQPVVDTASEWASMYHAKEIPQIPGAVADDASAFLQACLCIDPQKRSTTTQLLMMDFLLRDPQAPATS